jgi:ATP-binding cassette subfamily F protein uup
VVRRGLTYAERLELDTLLDRVDAAERAVAEFESRLGDPKLYAREGAQVPHLLGDLQRARTELERLTARWEELEAKREAAE